MTVVRMAYADPPYPEQSKRHYGERLDYFGEVDHAGLIERMERDFPDGWALSTSSSRLQEVLALCPRPLQRGPYLTEGTGIRVAAWCVSNGAHCPPIRVSRSWEPVIFRTVRWRQCEPSDLMRDFLVAGNATGFAGGTIPGQKPRWFCEWVFRLLGLRPGDELEDLFPGSGAVTWAWEAFSSQMPLSSLAASVSERASRRSLPGAQPNSRLGRGADVP